MTNQGHHSGQGSASFLATALRHPAFVLSTVAFLLLTPQLLGPASVTESANFNLVWAEQFRQAFRDGITWPRWLTGSFDGLGSPTFYFYAPLPFVLLGPLDFLTFGMLATERLLPLVAWLVLFLSGDGMRRWLRAMGAGQRAGLVGAIAYIAAPYHQYDLHVRGALGEFTAFAVLPYVALGIRAVASRAKGGATLLAVSWALLVCSHLPSTLVVAVAVLPTLLVVACVPLGDGRSAARFLATASMAGVGGMALSAAYWLPALMLLPHIAADQFWSGIFQAANWTLATPWRWPSTTTMTFIATVASVHGSVALWLLVRRDALGLSGKACILALGAVLAILAMALPLPFLWSQGSPMARIQFPWRMLLAVEFLLVGALVLAARDSGADRLRRGLRPHVLLLLGSFAVLLGQAGWLAVSARSPAWREARVLLRERLPDALEYLPRGAPLVYGDRPGEAVGAALAMTRSLASRPPAWAEPDDAARLRATLADGGRMTLEIFASEPARIVLRRFHFPAWRLETLDGQDGPPLEAHGPYRLSSFLLPAGETRLRLVPALPPPARAGAVVSLLALFVLVAVVLGLWRRLRVAARPSRSE